MFRVIEVDMATKTVLRAIPIIFGSKGEAVFYARHLNGRYEAMKRPTRFSVRMEEERVCNVAVPPGLMLPQQTAYPEPMYKDR